MDKVIVEKIQKLLQRTEENGCTAGEAQVAIAKARKLMAQYGIEMADLQNSEEVIEQLMDLETKSVSEIQAMIAKVIADHFGCTVIIKSRATFKKLVMIGEPTKVQVASTTFMFAYKCFKQSWASYHKTLNMSTSDKNSYRKSYLHGFMDGLTNELIKSESETALVIVKSKKLEEYLGNLHLVNKVFNSKGAYSKDIYNKGYQDGAYSQTNKNKAINGQS